MNSLKIRIHDREYNSYDVVNSSTLEATEYKVDAIKYKLFNHDVFTMNEDGVVTLFHSTVRSMPNIPGVLLLDTKRTYGKVKNKFLYKLIPDDKRLPEFLVAYKKKIGFTKKSSNKYVVFKFKHWDNKHPVAQLDQVIGDVNILDNFYEYQLYCKSLYASIQDFTKATLRKLKKRSEDEFIDSVIKKYNPEDRRSWDVYSIDPPTSKDFDDAFSFKEDESYYYLSVYISNVSFWMDALDLWDSFSQRISTIYLPNRKRPMLPTILSDAICSLQENQTRFAFTLDLVFNKTYDLVNYEYKNTCIRVRKNFRYETEELLNFDLYKRLFTFIKYLNRKEKYIDSIKTSHNLVAYLMIYMNYMSAKEMIKYKIGIFRSAELKSDFVCPDNVSENIRSFLKHWNSYGGAYLKFDEKREHEVLELDAYIHITSPIRRLVDLLNIIILQNGLTMTQLSEKATQFLNYWTSNEKIEYINKTMRSIRKVQNCCELLRICVEENKEKKKIYEGFIFDKMERNDGLYQYMIYLPEIKMVNRLIARHNKDCLTKSNFKLFTFMDESNFKQKIRVEFDE
tara:strand:- start:1521 stop:3218 length:1698 start_codon:yes stop_codon:yes gene_type:complete